MAQGKRNSADPKTMGGRIQRARIEMNMTRATLAKESGIDPKAIGHLEMSQALGRWSTIVAIARALDVSLYYVVGDREGYGSFGE